MSPIRIHNRAHVLVCDGSKALLFDNAGDARALDLKVVDVAFEPHPPSRAFGTERPGRVHESLGASRSAVRAADLHQSAETEFLRGVSRKIDEVVRERAVKHLVVVAPPKALGELRAAFTPAVKAVVTAEVPKDLARLSTPEIERRLTALGQLA